MIPNSSATISTKLFLICGVIACPLFMLIVFIEGAVRDGYSALQFPLSSLAIGNSGWLQITNFIFAGFMFLLFSIGLKQLFNANNEKFKAPLLVGLVGIGLMGAGVFVTDPIFGYPADKPLVLRQFTYHGHLHDAFSMFVFVCLPWACFVFRKRFLKMGKNGWANYSAFTGFAMITVFVLASMGFKQVPGIVAIAGLLQRMCLLIGSLWITLLAVHLVLERKSNSY